jgi:hypothetical protein
MWLFKNIYDRLTNPTIDTVPMLNPADDLEIAINPACLHCKGEFRDPDPGWLNFAKPIQKRLECRNCGVSTYVSKTLFRIWQAGPSHIPHMS